MQAQRGKPGSLNKLALATDARCTRAAAFKSGEPDHKPELRFGEYIEATNDYLPGPHFMIT